MSHKKYLENRKRLDCEKQWVLRPVCKIINIINIDINIKNITTIITIFDYKP